MTPTAELLALKTLLSTYEFASIVHGKTDENALAVNDAHDAIVEFFARPSLSAQAVGDGWLPIESAPEGKKILLAIEYPSGRKNVIRAMLAGHKTLPLSDEQYSWEGCFYDEEEDQTYCAPGWYETNENEETNWAVSEKAVGWQLLPSAPGATPPQPADGGDRVGELVEAAKQDVHDAWSNVWQWSSEMSADLQNDLIELRSVVDAALAKFQPAGGENDGR